MRVHRARRGWAATIVASLLATMMPSGVDAGPVEDGRLQGVLSWAVPHTPFDPIEMIDAPANGESRADRAARLASHRADQLGSTGVLEQIEPTVGELLLNDGVEGVGEILEVATSFSGAWVAVYVLNASEPTTYSIYYKDFRPEAGGSWNEIPLGVNGFGRVFDIDVDGSVWQAAYSGGFSGSASILRYTADSGWVSSGFSFCGAGSRDERMAEITVDQGRAIAVTRSGCVLTVVGDGNTRYAGEAGSSGAIEVVESFAHFRTNPVEGGCTGSNVGSGITGYFRYDFETSQQADAEGAPVVGCAGTVFGQVFGEGGPVTYVASWRGRNVDPTLRTGLDLSVSRDNGLNWSFDAFREPLPLHLGAPQLKPVFGLDENDDFAAMSVESSGDGLTVRRASRAFGIWDDGDEFVGGASIAVRESQTASQVDSFVPVVRQNSAQSFAVGDELIGLGQVGTSLVEVTVASWSPVDGAEPVDQPVELGLSTELTEVSDVATSPSGALTAFIATRADGSRHVFRRSAGGSIQDLGPIEGAATVAIADAGWVTVLADVSPSGFSVCSPVTYQYWFFDEWVGPNFVGFCQTDQATSVNRTVAGSDAVVNQLLMPVDYVFPTEDDVLLVQDGGFAWSRSEGAQDFVETGRAVQGGFFHVYNDTRFGRYSIADGTFESFVLPGTGASRVLVDPNDPAVLHLFKRAGSVLDVYRSSDAGGSWTAVELGVSVPIGAGPAAQLQFGPDGLLHLYDATECSNGAFLSRWRRSIEPGAQWSNGETLWSSPDRQARLLGVPDRPQGFVDDTQTVFAEIGGDLVSFPTSIDSVRGAFGLNTYAASEGGVNIGLGSLVWPITDVTLATAGEPLDLTRTYNSADDRVGLFGRGWSTPFEMTADTNCATGGVTVRYPDGRAEDFPASAAGVFEPPVGYGARLSQPDAGTYELEQANGMLHTFDAGTGALTSILTPSGREQALDYVSGELRSITDVESGRQITLVIDDGKVIEATTSNVSLDDGLMTPTWRYGYLGDDLERSCAATDPSLIDGHCTLFSTSDARITTIVDANGNVDIAVGYDGAGRIAWQENGVGDRTTYDRDGDFSVTTTDARGHTIVVTYDGRFRKTSMTDADGGVVVYEYDENGFNSAVTDANGLTTNTAFNARGLPVSETNPENETTWSRYDAFGNMTELRDGRSADGNDNEYLFTASWDGPRHLETGRTLPPTVNARDGSPTGRIFSTGAEPAVEGGLTPAGLLLTDVNTAGGETVYEYGANGDIRRVTSPLGLVTEYTHDELGRVVSQREVSVDFPNGAVTTLGYDEVGRIIRMTEPAVTNQVSGITHQLRREYRYDAVGNAIETQQFDVLVDEADRVVRQTVTTFDAADRPVSVFELGVGTSSFSYDPAGNLVVATDARGVSTRTEFDANNQAVSISFVANTEFASADEAVWEGDYDAAGRLVAETDGLGRRIEHRYDDASRRTETRLIGFVDDAGVRDVVLDEVVYDDAGNIVQRSIDGGLRTDMFTLDAVGRVVSTNIDPDGLNQSVSTVYDASGRMVERSVSDAERTESTRFEYDSAGNVTAKIVENGVSDIAVRYAYNDRGLPVSYLDPRNEVDASGDYRSTKRYDQLGRVVSESLPLVEVFDVDGQTAEQRPTETIGYNVFGDTTHVRDQRGNVTVSVFDQGGRVVEIERPAIGRGGTPSIDTFTYDGESNLLTAVDPTGALTSFQYDHQGRLVEQSNPVVAGESATTTWTYDVVGNVTATVNPIGAVTEMVYDQRNRLISSTDVVRVANAEPKRLTTTYGYDDLGNMTSMTTPLGHTSTAAFNAKSEIVTSTDALGKVTTYEHDVSGRQTLIVDPLGRRSVTVYDLAGRPIETLSQNRVGVTLATTRSEFDAAGNLTRVTKPQGVITATEDDFTTAYRYDQAGRLESVAQRISAVRVVETLYGYDAAGNLVQQQDGRGNTTNRSFNAWNLPTETTEPATSQHPDLADRTWTTEYDERGLAVFETQPGGTVIERTFDERGRQSVERGRSSNGTVTELSYGYDAASRVSSATSASQTLQFTYDDRGLLTQMSGAGTVSRFFYDNSGRLRRTVDAAGTSIYGWTPRNQLRSFQEPGAGETARFFYNAAGQQVRTELPDGGTRELSYDGFGRLRSDTLIDAAGDSTASTSYSYNRNGVLTSKTIDAAGVDGEGTHTYGYDQANRLRRWTAPNGDLTTYVFDDAGNRTRVNDVRFRFDERNRLTSTTDGDQFNYDARGDLVQSVTSAGTSVSEFDALGRLVSDGDQSYVYDALDRVINASGTEIAYAGAGADPVLVGDEGFGRLPWGALASSTGTDGSTTWWMSDRHNDVTVGATGAGDAHSLTTFDPFGLVLGTTEPDQAFGFQGDFTDPVSGRVWMGARWYDPTRGGFVSRDSYGGSTTAPLTANRYAYTSGDVLGMWDPTGFSEEPVGNFVGSGVTAPVDRTTVEAIRGDALVGVGSGSSGWSMQNAPSMSITAFRAAPPGSGLTQQFVVMSFSLAAGAACAGVGQVVGGTVAAGAAGNACAGVFSRAMNSMFAGEGNLESWTGAIWTPKTLVEAGTGAVSGAALQRASGLISSRFASRGAQVAATAMAGGAIFAAEGVVTRTSFAMADGASFSESLQYGVDATSIAFDVALGGAISGVSGSGSRNAAGADTARPSVTNRATDAIASVRTRLEGLSNVRLSGNDAGMIDLSVLRRGAPNRVIVDTNAVYNRPGTVGALRPGEVPVVTRTTPAEIANNAASGKLKPPGFLNELDVIDDVMDINTRINIRGQLEALRPGQRGLFGDGSIGATAVNTGSPVITADKNLTKVLESMGVEVRRP